MFKHLGLSVLLLAGCAMQPAPRQHESRSPGSPRALPAAATLPIRVGVEYLDSEHAFAFAEARTRARLADANARGGRDPDVLAQTEGPGTIGVPRTQDPKREPPRASEHRCREIEATTSFERVTLRFVDELSGYDARQAPRSLDQICMLEQLRMFALPEMRERFDERTQEERADLLERWQGRLLGRPLQRALRESPLVSDGEIALDVFRSRHLPLSEPYQETHPRGADWGRVSLRVRAGSDPLDVVWVRGGWRVGSSQERMKLGYTTEIAEDLALSLRSKYGYDDSVWELDATLEYRLTRQSRVQLLVSNHLDPLTEPISHPTNVSGFPLSPGVLFFVQHLF